MRRGLIARSKTELPDAVFDTRLERLRAAMRELDALVVYTNNTRPAAVSWLTGFIPYWSEAMLVVPRNGLPVLVVALTFRVKPWIERTSRVAEVIHAPRIGIETARLIAGRSADAAVGVVDFDHLPVGIVDDLGEAGPRLAMSDASDLFAVVRAPADPAEIMLTARASAIAATALSRAPQRRRGDLCRDGARPRARPATPANRGRARARPAIFGARQRCLQGELGAPRGERRPRWRVVRCCGGCFRRCRRPFTQRPRSIAILFLSGGGMPDRAAARSPDGLRRCCAVSTGRRCGGVGSGPNRGRRPAGPPRRASAYRDVRGGGEHFQ